MATPKEIIFEEEAREKLKEGIDTLADAVGVTLGPKGKNVAIESSWGAPTITNDGNSVVKDIELKDPYANMGVSMGKEVARKIKEKSGDGTTTGIILLRALVKEGIKNIASGTSPIILKRGMEKGVELVLSELDALSTPVENSEAIQNIATVSASGNETIGKAIAEAIGQVGPSGVITIEEGKGTTTTIEMVEGMQLDRGYTSPYFCTNPEKMIVEMESASILITDKKISSIQEILPLLEPLASTGKGLLIIAEDIEGDALSTLVVNKLRGTLKVAAIKAPSFGDRRKAMLEDIATLTGATVVSEEKGMELKEAGMDVLGSAEKLEITKEKTTIVGGTGHKEEIDARVKLIDHEINAATSDYDREKLEERKAKLRGGVAVIRVGAPSEIEMKQKKQVFEDSLNSTRAAQESGFVPGGGVSLLRASQKIKELIPTASQKLEFCQSQRLDFSSIEEGPYPKDRGDAERAKRRDADKGKSQFLECGGYKFSEEEMVGALIVFRACQAPFKQIVDNCGKDSSLYLEEVLEKGKNFGFDAKSEKVVDLVKMHVIDPAKVVKNSLKFAASVAGVVLISEALVTDAQDDEKDSA